MIFWDALHWLLLLVASSVRKTLVSSHLCPDARPLRSIARLRRTAEAQSLIVPGRFFNLCESVPCTIYLHSGSFHNAWSTGGSGFEINTSSSTGSNPPEATGAGSLKKQLEHCIAALWSANGQWASLAAFYD